MQPSTLERNCVNPNMFTFPSFRDYVPPEYTANDIPTPRENLAVSEAYEKMQGMVQHGNKDGLPAALIKTLFSARMQKVPECPNPILKTLYRRIKSIGAGGEGVVVLVSEKETQRAQVLKISNNRNLFYYPEVLFCIQYLLDLEITPHLTRIYAMMRIPCANSKNLLALTGRKPWVLQPENADFVESPKPEEKPLERAGFLMELLDGDLAKLQDPPTETEKVAIYVQIASVKRILVNSFKIYSMGSDQDRNIFYQRVDASTTFRGQKLINYDYWVYTVNGEKFYLPRMPFLVKLGDYDQWGCQLFTMETYLTEPREVFLENARTLFKKPDNPNATVLDMDHSSMCFLQ